MWIPPARLLKGGLKSTKQTSCECVNAAVPDETQSAPQIPDATSEVLLGEERTGAVLLQEFPSPTGSAALLLDRYSR